MLKHEKILCHFSIKLSTVQRKHTKEILVAFKKFWDTNPSESRFGNIVDGLILAPEMLHYMIKHPNGDKNGKNNKLRITKK